MSDLVKTDDLPGTVTPTSWVPPADLSYERWEANIAFLGRLSSASLFWLGDGIEFGSYAYGEKYAQALELTGKSYGRLKNITYTCRNVEKSRRRDGVSFECHTVVVPLPPDEQSEWLEQAAIEKLDDKALSAAINESRGLPPPSSYTDKLEHSNGNLKSEVVRLENELDQARAEADNYEAEAEHWRTEAEEARASDADTSDDGDGWPVAETLRCPHCGLVIEREAV